MTQRTLRTDVELLTYANAVRARSGHGLGIAAITAFFAACAIIDALASTPAIIVGL
jgi:hypothetical protein